MNDMDLTWLADTLDFNYCRGAGHQHPNVAKAIEALRRTAPLLRAADNLDLTHHSTLADPCVCALCTSVARLWELKP